MSYTDKDIYLAHRKGALTTLQKVVCSLQQLATSLRSGPQDREGTQQIEAAALEAAAAVFESNLRKEEDSEDDESSKRES